jgi:uncharacterized protein YgiM (DUF1202 family)
MMKTIWIILGTMMAASVIAQDNTNSLPAIPAPVSSPAAETAAPPAPEPEMVGTNAPAAKPVKHLRRHHAIVHKKPAAPEPIVNLTPGPAQVDVSELIVRGQAGLKGEMVAHLYRGDQVTVLEQINLSHHTSDEPSQWAKISYPTNAHVWVDAKYVDSNGTISSKKLNLRAGPGENYSVVGVLEHGASVTQLETKGNWMKIAPPTNAYAFVAAKYLAEVTTPPPSPAPPAEAPETPTTPAPVAPQEPIVMTPPTPMTPPPPPQPETPPVRIVQHEGIVGPCGSLVAPTDYKLYDLATKQDIDFLYPTDPNMAAQLKNLVDARVVVSGEEGIDQRWPNTPVMAIQNIQVVATNVIKRFSREDLTPPRLRH